MHEPLTSSSGKKLEFCVTPVPKAHPSPLPVLTGKQAPGSLEAWGCFCRGREEECAPLWDSSFFASWAGEQEVGDLRETGWAAREKPRSGTLRGWQMTLLSGDPSALFPTPHSGSAFSPPQGHRAPVLLWVH